MKPKEARTLIGQRVEWKEVIDWGRGVWRMRSGVLENVQGHNVLIDGDWKWLPNLTGLCAAPPPQEQKS